MSLVQILEDAKKLDLMDSDGSSVALALLPGLSDEEIASLEKEIGSPLPTEVRELLIYARGVALGFEVDFSGGIDGQDVSDFFTKSICISEDECGNSWVIDLTEDASRWGPIYFACHDAPVLLYQCEDLATFLKEMLRMCTPPNESLIHDVHEDRLYEVWLTNPGLIEQPVALSHEDVQIRAFAHELDERWFIKDLRNAKPGDGFSWGRFGPETEVRRFGRWPIFAIRKPEPGFLGRLFGKK